MAFEDKKIPYEILIRFDENGAPKGAHVQSRRIVTMDGEVLKDEILPAAPLALEGFPTSGLLTTATQAALVAAGALNDRIEVMEGELDAKALAIVEAEKQRDDAVSQASTLTAERNQLAEQIDGYRDQTLQLSSDIAGLRGTITALQAQIAAMQSVSTVMAEPAPEA